VRKEEEKEYQLYGNSLMFIEIQVRNLESKRWKIKVPNHEISVIIEKLSTFCGDHRISLNRLRLNFLFFFFDITEV
jgi:hypothetical protein